VHVVKSLRLPVTVLLTIALVMFLVGCGSSSSSATGSTSGNATAVPPASSSTGPSSAASPDPQQMALDAFNQSLTATQTALYYLGVYQSNGLYNAICSVYSSSTDPNVAFIMIGYGPGLPPQWSSSPYYALWKITPSGITEVGNGLIKPPKISGVETIGVCQIDPSGQLSEPYPPSG
jgi:hypothetical protein